MKGKMSYLAPEQITREAPTDRRADVWGLGVIAWELLAERKLFEGADDAQRMYSVLSQPIPSLSTIAPAAPAACVEAIARALERESVKRLPSADRLADVFEAEAMRLGTTEADVAAYMRSRFESELGRDRARITESLTLLSNPVRAKPKRSRVVGWAVAFAVTVAIAALSTAFIAAELDPPPEVATPVSEPRTAVATVPMQAAVEPVETAEPAPEETAEEEPAPERRRRRRATMHAAAESGEPPMRLDSMQILPNPF
jgi:serine/threonine-protein kinase